jgi:hypothetical protein
MHICEYIVIGLDYNYAVYTQVSPRRCEIVFDYFLEERCIQQKIEHGKQSHAALDA